MLYQFTHRRLCVPLKRGQQQKATRTASSVKLRSTSSLSAGDTADPTCLSPSISLKLDNEELVPSDRRDRPSDDLTLQRSEANDLANTDLTGAHHSLPTPMGQAHESHATDEFLTAADSLGCAKLNYSEILEQLTEFESRTQAKAMSLSAQCIAKEGLVGTTKCDTVSSSSPSPSDHRTPPIILSGLPAQMSSTEPQWDSSTLR